MSGEREGGERRNTSWHLKKEIPIATILAMISAIIVGSAWMLTMRADVNQNARDISTHVISDQRFRTETRDTNKLILEKLEALREAVSGVKVELAGVRTEQRMRYGRYLERKEGE